jgi:catechol 2,3-dioxygenase-like lactoylglutathione lyase family enzyme
MARVTGIGGIFLKTSDKDRLLRFWREALGIEAEEWGAILSPARDPHPRSDAVLSPFPPDTGYFDPSKRDMMVNLRVDDLDGVLARARAAGARVLDRREDTEQGRFGYVLDPDDLLIELWQPAAEDPAPSEAKS